MFLMLRLAFARKVLLYSEDWQFLSLWHNNCPTFKSPHTFQGCFICPNKTLFAPYQSSFIYPLVSPQTKKNTFARGCSSCLQVGTQLKSRRVLAFALYTTKSSIAFEAFSVRKRHCHCSAFLPKPRNGLHNDNFCNHFFDRESQESSTLTSSSESRTGFLSEAVQRLNVLMELQVHSIEFPMEFVVFKVSLTCVHFQLYSEQFSVIPIITDHVQSLNVLQVPPGALLRTKKVCDSKIEKHNMRINLWQTCFF